MIRGNPAACQKPATLTLSRPKVASRGLHQSITGPFGLLPATSAHMAIVMYRVGQRDAWWTVRCGDPCMGRILCSARTGTALPYCCPPQKAGAEVWVMRVRDGWVQWQGFGWFTAPVKQASRSPCCHGRTVKGCWNSTRKAKRRATLVSGILGQAAVPFTLSARSRPTRHGHGHAGMPLASLFVPWRPTRPQLGSGAEARKRLTSLYGSVCLNRIKAPLRNGTFVPIGPGQGRGRDAGEAASRLHARSKDEGPHVFAEAARSWPAMPASLLGAAPCVRKTDAHRVRPCKHRHGASGQAGSSPP